MTRINTQSNILKTGIVGLIALSFFILNVWTPLIADDFGLAFSYGSGSRIRSLSDIFVSLYHYYFVHGGRLIAFFFGHLFLLSGKAWFNFFNTIMYCCFLFLIYFHAFGSIKKFNPFVLLAIHILVWFTVPSWGEDFLWLNGSVVYLWPEVLALLFLIPYRKKMDNPSFTLNLFLSVLFFVPAVIAGSGNETLGASLIFLLLTYFILKIKKRESFAFFEISGLIGFLAGFIILYISPGTHSRAANLDMGQQYIHLSGLIKFTALAVWRFFESSTVLFGVIVLLCIELIYRQKQKINIVFVLSFMIAGLFGFISMAASPEFPSRVSFIGVIYFCIALLYLVHKTIVLSEIPVLLRRNIPVLFIISCLAFSFSFVNATKDIYQIHARWERRIAYILSQKEKGILDVEVTEPIPTSVAYGGKVAYQANKYMARGNDITTDPTRWPNISVAAYFGINSICGIENGDEIW
ncbi:MAG: DUF6056 family protein [Spirochaetaceae bacterium]|jgi:hypothetical protein|nr:DUF6056 family protein [Spirochaetaceae bacterium]